MDLIDFEGKVYHGEARLVENTDMAWKASLAKKGQRGPESPALVG